MRPWTRFSSCLPLLAALAASACTLKKEDSASEFREALPSAQAVAVDGPGTTGAAGSSSTASLESGSGLRAQTVAPASVPSYAKWYGFTRDMRDAVNGVTLTILGGVSLIVQSDPSETTADSATWGPYNDALDPAVYRLRVQRVAPGDYEYVLEGRPKASSSEADYRAVLSGKGYDRKDLRHGQGAFTIDLDAARALDPERHQNDSGSVAFEYTLPANIEEDLGALPRSIRATVAPQGPSYFSVDSQAHADHTGTLHVNAHGDTDPSKTTALEDVSLDSRYQANGAGRADITISGGDVPAALGSVSASECWGTDFSRSYYVDSANLAPSEGDPAACVYGAL